MDRRQGPSRAGFTLVEVLVAVLIIGILVALLLPAIQAAVRTARQAQVTAEINNLATALANFRSVYNDFPPSRIILSETGYLNDPSNGNASVLYASTALPTFDSNDSDISYNQLTQRSLLYLRKFWPRVNFNAGFDFNNNGKADPPYILSGSECLVFFLGGITVQNADGSFAATGFSKLPTNPFANNNASTNRSVPYFEFANSRLLDQDHDNIPSYMDPLDTATTRPYAYFSSYGNNAYDPNDDNGNGHTIPPAQTPIPELEDDGVTNVERGFTTTFPNSAGSNSVVSPAPNPYCTGTPVVSTGAVSWINPTQFQLFSCGQDRLWGLGGTYSQNAANTAGKLPILANPPDTGNVNGDTIATRLRESDNLTNFSAGRLD